MARLLLFLVTKRPGLIILGIGLIIAGVVWGVAGSHQVAYQNSSSTGNYHIGTGDQTNNVYINADGSSDYFVAFSADFHPAISQSDIDNSQEISFVAHTDTSSLDPALQLSSGGTISEAHKVVKLVFYDKTGATMATYTTDEYKANPNGFYDNEWLKSIWLVIGGAILLLIVIVASARRKPAPAGFASGNIPPYGTPPPPYDPSQQPYGQPQQPYGQPPYDPSQQPYGTPQPPYGQPPYDPSQQPYGTQPPPYGQSQQPDNPYGQTYQGSGSPPNQPQQW